MPSELPSTVHLTVRLMAPGLVVVGVLAAAALATVVPGTTRLETGLGAAAGALLGAVGCAILALAARRQVRPDDLRGARMSLQAAGLASFLLKVLGLGLTLAVGFFLDVKFSGLVALGVAFVAATVSIQVAGSLVLARMLARRAPPAASGQEEARDGQGGAPPGPRVAGDGPDHVRGTPQRP